MSATKSRVADIRATLEHLQKEGKTDQVFGSMLAVILTLDGIVNLLQELGSEGLLFPKSPDEFRNEFFEMLGHLKNQIDTGIYPDVVFTERGDEA